MAESLSLNTEKARKALENFWGLKSREPAREVTYHYLTTASIAIERDANFDGMPGIEAWRAAQTNIHLAEALRSYLVSKLPPGTALLAFASSATAAEFQAQVIRRFHWFTDQPGIEEVKQSVDDRLTNRLSALNIPRSLLERVRNQLESTFWDVVIRPRPVDRLLTSADLIRQIDAASVEYLPVPAGQFHQLLQVLPTLLSTAATPGRLLLQVMRLPVPGVPSPLLERAELIAKVKKHVAERRAVLLTGTVYKGKTTLAQLVAIDLCPDAWWFPLTERTPVETDNLLRALAQAIEDGSCPHVIVVDDIDLAPGAHAVYRHSLALVVHRATLAGCGMLLTARGASSDAATLTDFRGIEIVNVPEMSTEEVELHCISNGCTLAEAPARALFIHGATRGHPKLVQVRIAELAGSRWPRMSSTDLIGQSPALSSAKHFARRLLNDTAPPPVVEYVYTAAEASTPLSRAMLLHLGGSVEGLGNEGDVIDALRGKWLEPVDEDRLRITPMLQGSAAEAWPKEKRDRAHQRIYDAIASVRTLQPSDAAAFLFHAFMAQDAGRMLHTVKVLQGIENQEAIRQTYHFLMWLPFVALGPNQRFIDSEPVASLFLRQLQFDVAKELDSDSIPSVLDRWSEEIAATEIAELKIAVQTYQWMSLIGSQASKVPLRRQLDAISGLSRSTGAFAELGAHGAKRAIAMSNESPGGIPADATPTEFYLSMRAISVKNAEAFATVLDWLEDFAAEAVRAEFDSVIQWPLVQSTGAYVHGAWAAGHEDRTDWAPWLVLLRRARKIATRFNLRNFGRELAKAESIIVGESLDDHSGALRVLDDATQEFGDSITLQEQRANALFRAGEDARMLEVWEALQVDTQAGESLDPFAFRRAGIAAGRLQRWETAERNFMRGSEASPELQLVTTKIGLRADASSAAALGGAPQRAARLLSDAMLELPVVAFEDGHPDWEALLRTVSEYHRYIDASVTEGSPPERRLSLGHASMPGLKVPNPETNQLMRTQLMIAQAGELAARLGSVSPDYAERLRELADANFPIVRMVATSGLLALTFANGPGPSFVQTLAAYEQAFAGATSLSDRLQVFQDDSGGRRSFEVRTIPDEWFPVLVAAACCCDNVLSGLRANEWVILRVFRASGACT